MSGDDVYRSLMDLDLMLQDIDQMVSLKMFLGSVDPRSEVLAELHQEILDFTNRIERLVAVARSAPIESRQEGE